MQSVTIISPETRMFRVRITGVYALDLKTTAQMSGLWFEGNFDNFRTFKSATQDSDSATASPRWSEFEVLFTYETAKAHMLLAKILAISIYCTLDGSDGRDGRHFVGEAHTDLLHIALGPQAILLTVMNGDVNVGDLILNVEMEEVAETLALMRQFDIKLDIRAPFRIGDVQLHVETKCKQPQTMRVGMPRAVRGTDFGTWEQAGTHFLGITAMELMQEAGFRFTLTKGMMNNVVARGMVQFGAHMSAEQRLHVANQSAGEIGQVEQEVYFERVPLMNADGTAEVGTISGIVVLTNMPYFVQMYSGSNIDGEIFDGKRYADYLPLPPNVSSVEGQATRA